MELMKHMTKLFNNLIYRRI